MRKWMNLIEIKEYFDTSQYGAWLNTSGTIEYVDDHSEWIWNSYQSENYHDAYEDGWIRVILDGREQQGGKSTTIQSFQLNGYSDNITAAFKYWWPTALESDKLWIETEDSIPGDWYEYEMPLDRIKLQQRWR